MKKVSLCLAAVAMLSLVMFSCKKDETGASFKASIDDRGVKTSLDGDKYVCWSDGDAIKVYDGTEAYEFATTSGDVSNNGRHAIFRNSNDLVLGDGPYKGVYPASAYVDANHVTLPTRQEYDAAKQVNSVVMYANSNTQNLPFQVLGGMLKLTLQKTGTYVKSIDITTDKAVVGTFEVVSADDTYSINAATTSDINNSVRLKCGSATTGISIADAVDFYIFLPCGTYNTFDITVNNIDGTATTFPLPYGMTVTIARNTIYSFTRKGSALSFQDDSYDFDTDETVPDDPEGGEGGGDDTPADEDLTNLPAGAISALYSVSATQKVVFSMGNLQYVGKTSTWQFATSQTSVVKQKDQKGNETNTTRDLFGYGCNGYDWDASTDANNYQPYHTATTINTYLPHDMTGDYSSSDWGSRAISNGGNTANLWRTLTADEWEYLFITRNTTNNNIRFAYAKLGGVSGVVLFPDNFAWPNGLSAAAFVKTIKNINVNFINNLTPPANFPEINDDKLLKKLWAAGCVFLPFNGYLYGSTQNAEGGYYWCSTTEDAPGASTGDDAATTSRVYSQYLHLGRESDIIDAGEGCCRYCVRLVHNYTPTAR